MKLEPPKIGDLVRLGQHIGLVEKKRGLDLKVRWNQGILDDNGKPLSVDRSWHRRGDLEIISRA